MSEYKREEKSEKHLARMMFQDIKNNQKDINFLTDLVLDLLEDDIELAHNINKIGIDKVINDSQTTFTTAFFFKVCDLIRKEKLVLKD